MTATRVHSTPARRAAEATSQIPHTSIKTRSDDPRHTTPPGPALLITQTPALIVSTPPPTKIRGKPMKAEENRKLRRLKMRKKIGPETEVKCDQNYDDAECGN
ncbi:unnamed protein product [Calypogeia fissa]